jgi:ABC-type antimicrobial peptide transport system permease subunit
MGGAAGDLISTGLTESIRHSPYGGMLPPIEAFAPSVCLACMLTAGVIGVASSLVPALGASRVSIVNALRSED